MFVVTVVTVTGNQTQVIYSFSYYVAFSTALAHVFPNVFLLTAILCGSYTNFKSIHTVLVMQVKDH